MKVCFLSLLFFLNGLLFSQPTHCFPLRLIFHLYDSGIPIKAIDAFLRYNCHIDGLDKDYSNGKLSGYDPELYFNRYRVKLIDTASYELKMTYCSPYEPTFRLYTTNPAYLYDKKDLINPQVVEKMVIDYSKIGNVSTLDTTYLDSLAFKPGRFSLVFSEDTSLYLIGGRKYKRVKLLEQDSLILSKKTYNINEKIEFTAKVAETRYISTIVCSCGNTDFYYKVYAAQKDGWKLFIDHTDDWNQPQCACKIMQAKIINGLKYSIQPIKKAGTYYIEIKGGNFIMNSNPFIVEE